MLQVDHKVAIEGFCDSQKRVDAGRPPARFEARDRRLRRGGQLCQLLLREPASLALLGYLGRDTREEPTLVRVNVREAFTEAFEGVRRHIASLL
jgi:hypothetical protein